MKKQIILLGLCILALIGLANADLYDNFNDEVFDTTLWQNTSGDSGVFERGGYLEFNDTLGGANPTVNTSYTFGEMGNNITFQLSYTQAASVHEMFLRNGTSSIGGNTGLIVFTVADIGSYFTVTKINNSIINVYKDNAFYRQRNVSATIPSNPDDARIFFRADSNTMHIDNFFNGTVNNVDALQSSPATSFLTTASTIAISCNFTSYGYLNEMITDVNLTVTNSSGTLFYGNTETGINTMSYNKTWNVPLTYDGIFNWSCGVWGNFTEGNSDNWNFTRDTTNPTLTYYKPIFEGDNNSVRLEYLASDTNRQACFYSLDGAANVTVAGCANTTFGVVAGGQHNMSLYANDSAGNLVRVSRTFEVVDRYSEVSPNQTILESIHRFNITINDSNGLLDYTTLRFNNTDYIGTLIKVNGTLLTYRAIVTVPNVDATTTFYFNWSVTGTVGAYSDTYTYPTDTLFSDVLDIHGTSNGYTCLNPGGQYTLNFTFRNETNNALVTGQTLKAYFVAWDSSKSQSLNFSWTETHAGVSSYHICMSPNWTTVKSDIKLLYGDGVDWEQREFNLQEHTLNNNTQNFTLYMLSFGAGSTVTITVVDTNGIPLNGYLLKIYKYDYGNETQERTLVDSQVTDLNGIVISELDATEYYQFEVWEEGDLLHVFDPIIIKNNAVTLVVPLESFFDPRIRKDIEENVDVELSYDIVTGNVTGTFADNDNLISQMCLTVRNKTSNNFGLFGETCSSANSGTLVIHIGNSSNRFVASMVATAIEDGNEYVLETLDIDLRTGHDVFGKEMLLWGGVISVSTIALLGSSSPAAALTMGVFTLGVLGYMLDMIALPWTVLTFIVFLLLLYLIYLKD